MTDRNDAATVRVEHPCIGPLASHVEGFAALLASEGYALATIKQKCALLTDLSRWLEGRGLLLGRLDEGQLSQFRADRRDSMRRGDASTVQQLLGYLRNLGCIQAPPRNVDSTPVGELMGDFERFLSSERGLSPATLINYLPIVRRFLVDRFGGNTLHFDELGAADVHRFIVRHVQKGALGRAKLLVTALRSFLRFLQQRGAIATDLAAAIPGVASWRLSHLPKTLPPEQVERLVASCDRGMPTGRRDYAILLLLARLGLRGGEVVAMALDDLDWECGEIVVRGKGQRLTRLPLPTDVGAALADYLCHVRPVCSTRRVFIRMSAPLRGLAGPGAICCVIRRALKRAGLTPEFKGAHLLRHSLATNLLHRGASLVEIGQLLRHSQPTTTQIYAKVDIAALRAIGLPWPGAAS
ncbi:MAG: site-specific integrase [Defluviicoccus sp.]